MKYSGGMGDLEISYAGQYECVLFAYRGRRELNEIDGRKRHSDILKFYRVARNGLLPNHQKTMELL